MVTLKPVIALNLKPKEEQRSKRLVRKVLAKTTIVRTATTKL